MNVVFKLADWRLVVVGGRRGIGRACAEMAVSAGATVVVIDRDDAHDAGDPADQRAFVTITADACDPDSLSQAAERADAELGGIDAVINMVGGAHPQRFEDTTLTEWRREISFNLDSAFLVARKFLKSLAASPHGALVNSSSGYGTRPKRGHAAYSAAKGGVESFTRTLALEVAELGVRVNAIAPGATDTPRVRDLLGADGMRRAATEIPLQRVAQPEDCAAAAIFLACPAARHITGQVLHVNGGLHMA